MNENEITMNKKRQHQANDDCLAINNNNKTIKQIVYNCGTITNNPFNGEFCREKK